MTQTAPQPPKIRPPHRNRRLAWIAVLGVMLAGGLFLIFQALNENTQFFANASDVAAPGFQPQSPTFKMGGLVAEGTVETKGLRTVFQIEDFERDMARPITVTYEGALPDLFREGQGVVVSGQLVTPGEFRAIEILAKHDENYQPKINYADEKS